MSKRNLIIIGIVATCVAVAVLCIQQVLRRDLSFSDVTVECTTREGSSYGRFATYVVEGTVRNAGPKDCGAEDLPRIITDGVRKPKATLSSGTLASGDSCEVTYEGEFNMRGLEAPHLRFSCDLTFEGLDEAEDALNEGLRKLYDEYAEEVAIDHGNTEAQASLREQARESPDYVDEDARREHERNEAKKALEPCVGASASEAYEVAKGLGYTAYFKDTADVDVTADVRDGSGASGARSAKVTGAEVGQGTYVTFTLDHLEPEAASGREAAEVLTVDNCEDFAKLVSLVDNLDSFVIQFADKYAGRTLEFDAVVFDVMPHDGYEARYDYLFGAGDSYTNARGPNFKFEDIGAYDFHWVSDRPGHIGPGTLLHIVAKVDRYNSVQGLFFLEPVETSAR